MANDNNIEGFRLPPVMCSLYKQLNIRFGSLSDERCDTAELDAVDKIFLVDLHDIHAHLTGNELHAEILSPLEISLVFLGLFGCLGHKLLKIVLGFGSFRFGRIFSLRRLRAEILVFGVDPVIGIIVPGYVFLENTLAYLGMSDPRLPTWGMVIMRRFATVVWIETPIGLWHCLPR